MATPRLLPTVTTRSVAERGLIPAAMPVGTPITMATNIPPTATLKVTGNRTAMPEATLWFWNNEFPRWPWSTPDSQFQNC